MSEQRNHDGCLLPDCSIVHERAATLADLWAAFETEGAGPVVAGEYQYEIASAVYVDAVLIARFADGNAARKFARQLYLEEAARLGERSITLSEPMDTPYGDALVCSDADLMGLGVE